MGIRKPFAVLCLSFLASFCLLSQSVDAPFVRLDSFPTPASSFRVDKLQQVYLLTPNDELIKVTAEGKELFRYSNNRLGQLKTIDSTDPFNLLLFFPDFQTAVLLDRTLSATAELGFIELNLPSVVAVATSADNAIWAYDNALHQLLKINAQGEILLQSNNLNQELAITPAPTFMVANPDFVFMNDPNQGILVFDQFGQYQKTIDVKGIEAFQLLQNRILFREKDGLTAYDLRSLLFSNITLPFLLSDGIQVVIQQNNYYFLHAGGMSHYGLRKR